MKAAGCHVAGYEVIIYVASHLDVHAAYKVLVHAVVVDHGLGSHGRGRAHVILVVDVANQHRDGPGEYEEITNKNNIW